MVGAQDPHPNPLPEGVGADLRCCANLLLTCDDVGLREFSWLARKTLTPALSQWERGLI